MNIAIQAEPVARSISSAKQPQGEIEPQACWCIDPDGSGMLPSTWWCEMGRELLNTGVTCSV